MGILLFVCIKARRDVILEINGETAVGFTVDEALAKMVRPCLLTMVRRRHPGMTLCLDRFVSKHFGRTEARNVQVLQAIIQKKICIAPPIGAEVEVMEVEDP